MSTSTRTVRAVELIKDKYRDSNTTVYAPGESGAAQAYTFSHAELVPYNGVPERGVMIYASTDSKSLLVNPFGGAIALDTHIDIA